MSNSQRPRSPSDRLMDHEKDKAGESSSSSTRWNPPKRQKVDLGPRTGAESVPRKQPPNPGLWESLRIPQGHQIPGRQMIVILLEPGTDLQLRLEDEVLTLGPQEALELDLIHVLILVIPEKALKSSEQLWDSTQECWLRLTGTDPTWEIDIETGSLRAQTEENVCVSQAEEEGEAPQGPQPLKAQAANLLPGIRCSSQSILYLKPRYTTAAPKGSIQMLRPTCGRRALPPEFQVDLYDLEPLPSSALRPLPPSSSPGPRLCHKVFRRPIPKAQKHLFKC
ncbi:proline-rich protein 23D1-like [Nycticebus coucang]|uniref:proline-rich protein 23D1-like n=1 Tax=Nycticebus coucang TaxID=9470 RepID=UPI00234D6065|nr:proline-rich protein 23D1-like [Nycticebus coucang]